MIDLSLILGTYEPIPIINNFIPSFYNSEGFLVEGTPVELVTLGLDIEYIVRAILLIMTLKFVFTVFSNMLKWQRS